MINTQGRMYDKISATNPLSGQQLQFASLYFHNIEYESISRKQRTLHWDSTIIKDLVQMLEDSIHLVKFFFHYEI